MRKLEQAVRASLGTALASATGNRMTLGPLQPAQGMHSRRQQPPRNTSTCHRRSLGTRMEGFRGSKVMEEAAVDQAARPEAAVMEEAQARVKIGLSRIHNGPWERTCTG